MLHGRPASNFIEIFTQVYQYDPIFRKDQQELGYQYKFLIFI